MTNSNDILRFFDRQGNPLTLTEWADKFEDFAYRVVARETVRLPGGACLEVCTVWSGHADDFMDEKLFHTGYKVDDGQWVTISQYDTEDRASAGHKEVVDRLQVDLRPTP